MSKVFYRFSETSAPAQEPVTLQEMKAHLRVDHASDDSLITAMISSARMVCENFTGRAFITRDISLYLDAWPAQCGSDWWDGVCEGAFVSPENMALTLQRGPLFSVTDIRLYDAQGNTSTYSSLNYLVDTTGPRGRIILKDSAAPPAPARTANGIEVRFKAGYGALSSAVPAPLKEAVRQTAAYLYEYRGDGDAAGMPPSVRGLLQPYRLAEIA